MLTQFTYTLQGIVMTILSLAALLGGAVGTVLALTTREDAFRAAGKLTKTWWSVILGVSTVVVLAFGVLGLLGLVAAVAIIVYWVDVRPATQRVQGRGRQDGPYGPW